MKIRRRIGILRDLVPGEPDLAFAETQRIRCEVFQEGLLPADDERAGGERALRFEHLRQRLGQGLRGLSVQARCSQEQDHGGADPPAASGHEGTIAGRSRLVTGGCSSPQLRTTATRTRGWSNLPLQDSQRLTI